MSFRRLFSLVELLICIGIVSVLMTLLSPSLKKMVNSARQTQCQNKMRTVIQAQYLRAEDNRGYFGKSGVFDEEPFPGYFDELCEKVYGTEHIGFYGVEIAPYLGINLNEKGWSWRDYWLALRNPEVMDFLICPSDEEPKIGAVVIRYPLTQWQGAMTSFLMNGNLLSKTSYNNHYLSADSNKVENPSTLMMMSDARDDSSSKFTWAWGENRTYYDLAYPNGGISRDTLAVNRHGFPFENNVGFVDGHVIKASIDDFKNIYVTQSRP